MLEMKITPSCVAQRREFVKQTRAQVPDFSSFLRRVMAREFHDSPDKRGDDMRISKIAALAAVTAALGLAACGGSGFKAKMQAECEKQNGELPGVGKVDCACAAGVMDAEFPADAKDFFVKMMDVQDNPEAMKDIDPAELMSKMEAIQKSGAKAEERVKAECKKS